MAMTPAIWSVSLLRAHMHQAVVRAHDNNNDNMAAVHIMLHHHKWLRPMNWAGLGWAGLGCNELQQQQSDAPSDAVKPFQFNGGTEHLLIVNLPQTGHSPTVTTVMNAELTLGTCLGHTCLGHNHA